MSYEFYIAKRYLLSKRRIGFITIIMAISIVGVTVGVAALISVLSVFNGFNSLVTSILVGFDPHIRIETEHDRGISDYSEAIALVRNERRVKAYSPFVSEKAMIIARNINRVIFVKGVDDTLIGEVSDVKKKTILGKFELRDTSGVGGIVIGLTLSDRLGIVTGDSVSIVSSAGMENALTQFPQPVVKRYRVVGIFESNNKDYDAFYAYLSIRSAQRLFRMGDRVHGVELRLFDINDSEGVKESLLERLGKPYRISTWYDLHKQLYSVMKIERWTAYIILCMIIAVATFNILGSLTMAVIEKKRDIGVLKSMGVSNRSIIRIFMFEGILVGVVGTAVGSLLGFAICYLQQRYGLFPLDPTVYIIPAIPVEMRWTDFVAVGTAALVLCFLASLYPAKRAASLVPIEAIRWE
jgi:lipoprotein-releasing system permease protein